MNDNDDVFLKQMKGVSPIKKNNRIKKENLKTNYKPSKNKLVKQKIFTAPTGSATIRNTEYRLEKIDLKKEIKKKSFHIDKKIDFHGMSLIEAEELLFNTVISCYNTNKRCILFITGKGVNKKETDYRNETRLYYGKIRSAFFSWIRKPEIEKYILGVEQASMGYGADGAFFVYLRKKSRAF